MTQEELLAKGYFPKELPPAFTTEKFASKIDSINSDWKIINQNKGRGTKTEKEKFKEKFWESKWITYSIPKVGFSRRLLGIPNPYHQDILVKTMIAHWSDIQKIFNKSKIVNSRPIVDDEGGRALRSINTFKEFKRNCLINSFDKLYELRTDVSRYYGTIYTHIIPWIIHTKEIAKSNRKDNSLLGNLLDKNLREANSGQTLGIPIGPDTSLVISEIIGCTMDELIQKKFKRLAIKTFRYIDDYYIYCDNQSDAEKVFKFIQKVFTDFQLDINEEKTKISKSPFPLETSWSIELGSFVFRNLETYQQTDLERFATLVFRLAMEHPKDTVLNFAISILKSLRIHDSNWELYQAIVLKIALTEPVTLPAVANILLLNKSRAEKVKIKNITENIIKEHVTKGHHFEVAWALWICKEFEVTVIKKLAEQIFNSNDVVSILIGLDLKKMGLITADMSIKNIENELTAESLMDNKWILTYESIRQGFVKEPSNNPISNNEYFELLNKHEVSFYDGNISLIEPPSYNGFSIFDINEYVTPNRTVARDKLYKRKRDADY